MDKATLYIVIPCYNEEKMLPIAKDMFLDKLESLMFSKKISYNSKILFVNDGSKDNTWKLIKSFADETDEIVGISQSKNRGQQSSLVAGLMEVKDKCDIAITMDCDGQDDIDAIDRMIDAYYGGCEVVYGVRDSRDTDTFFKRNSALLFYKLMNLMGTPVIYNHAEYRLMSSKVLKSFSDFKEVNIFLRGLFPLIGFKSTCVYYTRKEREAGESHYPFNKMLNLALDGITSFSSVPLRLIFMSGVFLFLVSIIFMIISLVLYGKVSIPEVIFFVGSLNLTALGIIAEYIAKIYMEVKHRPVFIIEEKTENLN